MVIIKGKIAINRCDSGNFSCVDYLINKTISEGKEGREQKRKLLDSLKSE